MKISSVGGMLLDGTNLYSYLAEKQDNGMNFTSKAVGLAASSATFPWIAAPPENRLLAKQSEIMIHEVSLFTVLSGNLPQIENQYNEIKEGLTRANDKIVDIYVSNTNNTPETIRNMLSKDTFMNEKEARLNGFLSGPPAKIENKSEDTEEKKEQILKEYAEKRGWRMVRVNEKKEDELKNMSEENNNYLLRAKELAANFRNKKEV